jgi:hypothetical protein
MADRTPPATITPEMFLAWRSPVRGNSNPQSMTNPVWKWLIQSRLSAWQASELFRGPAATSAGPGWCFDRFGQSSTALPDGRTLLIAGEHEDYYDPDFFIYNDVVLVAPDGDIEILGYAPEAFPPTDFHSATLVEGQVVLVGNLGYPDDRRKGTTQVLTLGLQRWQMSAVQTVGVGPGWIHKHDARLERDGRDLVITGGEVDRCDGHSLVENIDDWRLSLEDWRWERLTMRRWPRFEVFRKDRRQNHLWSMRQALWSQRSRRDDPQKWLHKLQAELGSPAQLDLVPVLYRPPVAHEVVPEDPEEYAVYRIRIDAVVVRFVEDGYSVQVTIEGELPAEVIEQIRNDLTTKLQALEQSPVEYRVIAS